MVHAEFAITLLNFEIFRNCENLDEFGKFLNFFDEKFPKIEAGRI